MRPWAPACGRGLTASDDSAMSPMKTSSECSRSVSATSSSEYSSVSRNLIVVSQAPAGLPHVRLAGLEAAELQRPGLGAVYECIDVSLSSTVVASSNLPLGICFVDAKAGADTQGAPLRRAALRDVLTPWLLSPRTRHAASEPFVPSCLTVRHGSSLGRLLHSAERESPRPLRAVARGVFLLVPLWQGDVTGIVAV